MIRCRHCSTTAVLEGFAIATLEDIVRTEAIRFDDGIDIVALDIPTDPQGNADIDGWVGSRVAAGQIRPTIRLWKSARNEGISVSRREVAHPAGADAANALRSRGLSVVVRQTGGTAVPQGAGVFHVSWLLPRPRHNVTTDAYFRLLCQPILDWLREEGTVAATGALEGSYCDGNYNVLAEGRKLAGTAQAWRGGLAGIRATHPGYILAHACITTEVDFATASAWINEFCRLSQNPYRVQTETSVSLRQLHPNTYKGLSVQSANGLAMASLGNYLKTWLTRHQVRVNG